ncbi:hypothetical protein C4J81_18300 [Deltaproteobacteria bacterium Smac51]|nr:hypothetical protein C4J81_18300 [Deltaproteobacteria bacterium Smac51]
MSGIAKHTPTIPNFGKILIMQMTAAVMLLMIFTPGPLQATEPKDLYIYGGGGGGGAADLDIPFAMGGSGGISIGMTGAGGDGSGSYDPSARGGQGGGSYIGHNLQGGDSSDGAPSAMDSKDGEDGQSATLSMGGDYSGTFLTINLIGGNGGQSGLALTLDNSGAGGNGGDINLTIDTSSGTSPFESSIIRITNANQAPLAFEISGGYGGTPPSTGITSGEVLSASGNGGKVFVDLGGIELSVDGDMSITGGAANSAEGGQAELTTSSEITVNGSLSLTGGTGGQIYSIAANANGGGGMATLISSSDITAEGLKIMGGNGHETPAIAFSDYIKFTDGGLASLTAAHVISTDGFTIAGGSGGESDGNILGGGGGAVKVEVENLTSQAGKISISGGDTGQYTAKDGKGGSVEINVVGRLAALAAVDSASFSAPAPLLSISGGNVESYGADNSGGSVVINAGSLEVEGGLALKGGNTAATGNGHGGSVTLTVDTGADGLATADTLSVAGGDSTAGGQAANGGNALLSITGDFYLTGNSIDIATGTGNTGGSALVDITGSLVLTGQTEVDIQIFKADTSLATRSTGAAEISFKAESLQLEATTATLDTAFLANGAASSAQTNTDEVSFKTLSLRALDDTGSVFIAHGVNVPDKADGQGTVWGQTFSFTGLETFGTGNALVLTGLHNNAPSELNRYKPGPSGVITINLPADLKDGDILLNTTLAGLGATAGNQIDFQDFNPANFILKQAGDFTNLEQSDKITLINGVTNITPDFLGQEEKEYLTTVTRGLTTITHSFGLIYDQAGDGVIEATYHGLHSLGGNGEPQPQEGHKAYFESSLGAAVAVAMGSETGQNMAQKAQTAISAGSLGVTSDVNGSSGRYKTGSHVDADNFGVGLGLAKKFSPGYNGTLTIGGYIEGGKGSYDTYNHTSNLGNIHGEGKSDYFGGGLFLNYEFECGFYLEAGARTGRVSNRYEVKDRPDTKYDTSTPYHGASAGLGRKFELTDTAKLDVYGKAFWTHLNADSAKTKAGERLSFDATDSLRTRIGARLTRSFKENAVKSYIGAAWEHEYDSESSGSVDGRRLKEAPDMKGSSAYGELGLILQPQESPVSFELGVFGLSGKQETVGGTLGVRFNL